MSYSFQGWEHDLDRYLTTPPDEEKPVHECCICGKGIYEGMDYYEVDDEAYCEDCMVDSFRKVAERGEY